MLTAENYITVIKVFISRYGLWLSKKFDNPFPSLDTKRVVKDFSKNFSQLSDEDNGLIMILISFND